MEIEAATIEVASAETARRHLATLSALLVHTVDAGASIGWLPPLATVEGERYWQGRIDAIGDGTCVLFLGWVGDVLAGSAQLGLELRENGNHRAEVQKVMVHGDFRRRGIGRALLRALEAYAVAHGRSLLFLDTRLGDAAEALYVQMGYQEVGRIPNYVKNPGGGLVPTVLYYKIVGDGP